jgi:hypothetical protein
MSTLTAALRERPATTSPIGGRRHVTLLGMKRPEALISLTYYVLNGAGHSVESAIVKKSDGPGWAY